MKNKIEQIKRAIENYDSEYEYYGIRFHRGESIEIGSTAPCSYRWDDGEITEDELDGTSALDLKFAPAEKLIEMVGIYVYGEGEIIIIAGDFMECGEDEGEIIIKDAVRVA